MVERSHELLRAGARVSARGDAWTVVSRTRHADCESLKVSRLAPEREGGRMNEGGAPPGERTLLLPFDRVTAQPAGMTPRVVGNHRWAGNVLRILAGSHPFGALATAAGARIDLLPFQMAPALAMLRHAHTRVLIADEVGLGKTIQAGLLLRELSNHVDGFRSVIVTPAALREQWLGELSARFALDAVLADAAWLSSASRGLPPDVNPWALPGLYLASLDFVKRPEVLRSLEDVTWDLFVLDEAHGAGTATARLRAACALGVRSRRVLLLTATPPDGDPPALAAITDIGRLPGDDPLVEFRRTRCAAGVSSARRTVLLQVRLSTAERRMHRLLERYTQMIWTETGARKDPRGRLASAVLRKRALSSAWSLAASVHRRASLLDAMEPEPAASQLRLPLDNDDTADEISDQVLGAPGLADRETERDLLERIEACARVAVVRESKLEFLRRYLTRAREPALVFTEYRDTLLHLERALRRAGFEPLLLHGGMPPRERTAVQQAFNAGGMLLLATDAASEGLNLHARCRLVVHFELPWTPARLAQRTGRVDRLGQRRTVHEVLLVARHTAERVVLAPLVRRARIAGRHAGAGRGALAALTESRVTQAVMEGCPLPVPETGEPVPLATLDLHAEAHREVERIGFQRRFGQNVNPAARPVVPARTLLTTGSLTLVYQLALEDHHGRGVHHVVVPLAFDMGEIQSPRRAPEEPRELVRRFEAEHGAQVRVLVEVAASADVRLATAQHAAVLERLQRRERGVAEAQPLAAQGLVQPGLFDRRAVRRADARRRAAALLAVETGGAGPMAASAPLISRVTLVAARLNARGAG